MDANFSADSGSNKDPFFKPKRAATLAARHVSLTIKIRFLHNDPGISLQNAPEPKPVAVVSCTQHHEQCRNPLTAIVNGIWRAVGSRWHIVIRRFHIRLPGLLRTTVLAKTGKLLLQRIQTTGLVSTAYQPSVIANATGARNDGMHVASAQRGAVLITGLIFLVILMLIGTTSMQGTLLEERMAGNLRDETLAFQTAEAALRSGERFLEQVTLPEFNGSDGLYHYADSPAPADLVSWGDWETSGKTADVAMDGVASQPRYIIEQLPGVSLMGKSGSAQQSGSSQTASMFRIVARGVGGNDATTALLQSTYQR